MPNLHLGVSALRLLGPLTGVGRYLRNLLRAWAASPLPFARVTLFVPEGLPDELLPARSILEECVVPGRVPPAIWEHLRLPRYIRDVDVLFCPSYVAPLTYRGRFVVTIHDMLQESRPGDFPWMSRIRHAPLYRRSARRARMVITDSEASAGLIRGHYGVEDERLRVLPLAPDPNFGPEPRASDAEVRARLGVGDAPLILFVGKLSRRRHVLDLIAAFAGLRADGAVAYRLVLVGLNSAGLPVRKSLSRHGLSDVVVHLPQVSDDDLAALFRMAVVFVYPSEEEGFGLPLLEAMASGTPVITLRRPVLVEVAASAAWYTDSGSPDALLGALRTLLSDPSLRESLRRRGLDRATAFSWTTTARRTMEILHDVATEDA